MNRAKEEALEMDQYDYLIINDDLQECVEEMHQIIQGEHRRSFRNAEFIEHMKEELKGKKFLITGGTGSFGHAVTDRLLKEGAGEIVIFSRDEKKQFDMAKEYGESLPALGKNALMRLSDVRKNFSVHWV